MFRFFTGVKKEFLLLIRDLPGLGILFLMPVLLILIVSLAQQNALKSSKEKKTDILFLDQSGSSFSKLIASNLEESGMFHPIQEKNPENFISLIAGGKYPAGLRIKEKDFAIEIITDPTLQSSYKNSLKGSLTYLIKGTQSRVAIEGLLRSMAPGMEENINRMISSSIKNMTPVKEMPAHKPDAVIKPTLTQNLIPGFILFAMFFITLPLSGSLINEKHGGTWLRIKALPVSTGNVLAAKIAVYLIVCVIQFLLMLMVGMWMLPAFFGIPALQIGQGYFLLTIATISAALAATGFGLLIGSFASTHAQASVSGSMIVVILAVLSGTFLPVYLMPEFLQKISSFSPIRWGVDTYLDVFIREASLRMILPKILYMLAFFAGSLLISVRVFRKNI